MNQGKIKCPDCENFIERQDLKNHIVSCKAYKPNLLNSIIKLTEHLNQSYLNFISAELDLAKQKIDKKYIEEGRTSPSIPEDHQAFDSTLKLENFPHSIIKQETKQPQRKQQSFQDIVICVNCLREIEADKVQDFTYTYLCFHLLCKQCLTSYINDQYLKKKGSLKCLKKGCTDEIPADQIKEIIGKSQFQKLSNSLLREMCNLVVCCKCNEEFQFLEGKASDAPKKDTTGKKLSSKGAQEFAKNRFNCPKCKTDQCRNCKSAPYHLGMNCEENLQFKEAKYFSFLSRKCRYCKGALKKGYSSHLGIKSFNDICSKKQCEKIAKKACSKIHKCGHSCLGYLKEKQCLPCLHEKCVDGIVQHDQNLESYCSICYVEDLQSKPCIASKCGHIFHYECIEKRIQIRWLTPRILFNFCQCPLCKKWINFSEDSELFKKVKKYEQLFEAVKEKAMKRLKFQELTEDKKITDPSSPYYKKPEEYAMAIYAYFECFKCQKPYFGGRKNCADAMNEGRDNEDYDKKKLICPECCQIPIKNCEKHGKQFLAFKCKFCCNIAQWFCWGNTHFCDPCHKKQIQGKYVSKMKKQDLPKCEGPEACPSGGNHKDNGEQYSLGCLLCRNYKQGKKDF